MKSLVQYISEKLVINRNTKVDDEAADLGLKVKWAKCNVGAEKDKDRGLYFSWGNTEGHYDDGYKFNEENYKKTNGSKLTKSFKPGDKEYDAATANMGSEWRMPTKDEFKELYDNTEHKWTEIDGVKGMKFSSKKDTETFVFFPAAGYYVGTTLGLDTTSGWYWSVDIDIDSSNTSRAYYMSFDSSDVYPADNIRRYYGFSVRAVQN